MTTSRKFVLVLILVCAFAGVFGSIPVGATRKEGETGLLQWSQIGEQQLGREIVVKPGWFPDSDKLIPVDGVFTWFQDGRNEIYGMAFGPVQLPVRLVSCRYVKPVNALFRRYIPARGALMRISVGRIAAGEVFPEALVWTAPFTVGESHGPFISNTVYDLGTVSLKELDFEINDGRLFIGFQFVDPGTSEIGQDGKKLYMPCKTTDVGASQGLVYARQQWNRINAEFPLVVTVESMQQGQPE